MAATRERLRAAIRAAGPEPHPMSEVRPMSWLARAWAWLRGAARWFALAVSVLATAGVALLWRAWRRALARAERAEIVAEVETRRRAAAQEEARVSSEARVLADAERQLLHDALHAAAEERLRERAALDALEAELRAGTPAERVNRAHEEDPDA